LLFVFYWQALPVCIVHYGLTLHYIIGNAKNVSTIVKDAKIPAPQLIISSPPYFDLLNYNDNKDQIGHGQKNYDEYLETVCKVYQDCYDISLPNATFWLVVDTFKKNKEVTLFPFDIVNKLKVKSTKTWKLRDIVIWDKDKNLPWGGIGNFKNQYEYILFFTKNKDFKFNIDRVREITDLKKWWKTYPERYNPDGKAPSNIWNFITPIRGWGHKEQDHLCPLPFPLTEKIISLCSDEGDWVLDPFAGSGSLLRKI
jgi:DNA modification methylase